MIMACCEPWPEIANLVECHMKKYLSLLILGWHVLGQAAAPEIPADAIRVLESTHKQYVLKSIDKGKLRPGVAEDVVAVIREEEEGAEQQDRPFADRTLSYRIVVLAEKENEKGKYFLQHETEQLGELRNMYEFGVEIRNGSLHLHTTSSRPDSAEYYFQFKYSKGIFRLVGVEGDMSSSVEGEGGRFFKTSVNFLIGLRKDETTKVFNGKKTVTRKQSRFSLAPVPLEKFDLQTGLAPAVDD
ncbi:MAG: hypothetical protein JWR21_1836 [Herminiimonas sp.]|nr:hypothetical protein [Herminiimonas sp.]